MKKGPEIYRGGWLVFSELVSVSLAYISVISLAILQKEKLGMYTNTLRMFPLL